MKRFFIQEINGKVYRIFNKEREASSVLDGTVVGLRGWKYKNFWNIKGLMIGEPALCWYIDRPRAWITIQRSDSDSDGQNKFIHHGK